MTAPIDEIKNRLRKALTIRQMSPAELSEKTGISKSSISQYMSGYANPKNDRIYLISKALNVNEAWIMGFDAPMDREKGNNTLSKYRQLNNLGQQKADEYIDDLLENPKYRLQQQNSADTTQQTTADEQKRIIERMLERQKDKNRFDVAAFGEDGVHSGVNEVTKETIEEILNKHKK